MPLTNPAQGQVIKSIQRGTSTSGNITISTVDPDKCRFSFLGVASNLSNDTGGGATISRVVLGASSITVVRYFLQNSFGWQLVEYT